MANFDNYYDVLGLAAGASFEEIRSAYRQLALEMHPDVAGPLASPRFIRVNRAYETLIDPQRRGVYDRELRDLGHRVVRQTVVTTTRVGSSVFFNSLLADVLTAMAREEPDADVSRMDAATAPPQRIDVQPVRIELVLTPEAARGGAEVRLDLPVSITCNHCRGTGLAAPFVCPVCRGRGRWSDTRTVRFFLAPPIRDGQIVTLDLREADIPAGQVSAHIRLSWL